MANNLEIEEDYTYTEWLTGIMVNVDLLINLEVMKSSHSNHQEQPREIISKLKRIVTKYEGQIPDDI